MFLFASCTYGPWLAMTSAGPGLPLRRCRHHLQKRRHRGNCEPDGCPLMAGKETAHTACASLIPSINLLMLVQSRTAYNRWATGFGPLLWKWIPHNQWSQFKGKSIDYNYSTSALVYGTVSQTQYFAVYRLPRMMSLLSFWAFPLRCSDFDTWDLLVWELWLLLLVFLELNPLASLLKPDNIACM